MPHPKQNSPLTQPILNWINNINQHIPCPTCHTTGTGIATTIVNQHITITCHHCHTHTTYPNPPFYLTTSIKTVLAHITTLNTPFHAYTVAKATGLEEKATNDILLRLHQHHWLTIQQEPGTQNLPPQQRRRTFTITPGHETIIQSALQAPTVTKRPSEHHITLTLTDTDYEWLNTQGHTTLKAKATAITNIVTTARTAHT